MLIVYCTSVPIIIYLYIYIIIHGKILNEIIKKYQK